jgi:YjbE family integral membrane protein
VDIAFTPEFWIAVGQIILIDILLGGDNAVVIALACRQLPPNLRTKGVVWGTAGAILIRVVLIFFALTLLSVPYLKLVGAVLLLWIGVKLLAPDDEEGHGNIQASDKLWGAVRTVIIADLVMSVDNVIAIAGAAENAGGDHKMPLVIFGLLVSIPIIVGGSQLVLKLMDRFPLIITLGGMLLGWIGGTMAVTDPAIVGHVPQQAIFQYAAGAAGALIVLALGLWRKRVIARRAADARPAVAPVVASVDDDFRRLLLAADGSPAAEHATQRVIDLRNHLRDRDIRIHVVNVQRPLPGDVASFVSGKTIEEYQRERSDKALAPTIALLQSAGIPYEEHHLVGNPGPTIARVADEKGCHLIVMGSRGLGSFTGAAVGSVAQSTLEHASVPVLMVK